MSMDLGYGSAQMDPSQGYYPGYNPYLAGGAPQAGGQNQVPGAMNIFPGGAPQQAHAPEKKEKPGFFSKLGAVVKGIADIPGKLVGAVKDVVTDPKKLLLAAGGIALSIAFPPAGAALLAYGVFQGGKMALEGGVQAAQGWANDDLGQIEDGVANAGTGAVVAGVSVAGIRGGANAAGVTSRQFMSQNTKALFNRNTYSLSAAKANLAPYTQAASQRISSLKAGGVNGAKTSATNTVNSLKNYTFASTDDLLARLNGSSGTGAKLTPQEINAIQSTLTSRGITLGGTKGNIVISNGPSSTAQGFWNQAKTGGSQARTYLADKNIVSVAQNGRGWYVPQVGANGVPIVAGVGPQLASSPFEQLQQQYAAQQGHGAF